MSSKIKFKFYYFKVLNKNKYIEAALLWLGTIGKMLFGTLNPYSTGLTGFLVSFSFSVFKPWNQIVLGKYNAPFFSFLFKCT